MPSTWRGMRLAACGIEAQSQGVTATAVRRRDRASSGEPASERALAAPSIAQRLADLSEQAAILVDTAREIAIEEHYHVGADLQFWAEAVHASLESHRRDLDAGLAVALDARLHALEKVARSMALSMEFDFLLDPDRLLLSIGYEVREGALDQQLL